jgi:Metallo-beta-lactamase superfamily
MGDTPTAMTASHAVLYTGYASPGVAATVGFIQDRERRVVTDPGMVRHHSLILGPLGELGVAPEQVTDVVFSHHHPDTPSTRPCSPTPASTTTGPSTTAISGSGATPKATS